MVHRAAVASGDADAVRMGPRRRRGVPRLPRRGMGRAGPRGTPPVRDADARGRAGGPVVVDDPAQTGRLPGSVRRVRSRGRRPVHAGPDRTAAPRSVDRAQPREGDLDGRRTPRRCCASARRGRSTTSCGRSSAASRSCTDTARLGEVPAETPESRAMSKELKRRGFGFVGPTVCYAFMQACGFVNDHVHVMLPLGRGAGVVPALGLLRTPPSSTASEDRPALVRIDEIAAWPRPPRPYP